MDDVYVRLLLGHLLGDYLLQPRWMALRKSEATDAGLAISVVHSILYTACICLFLWTVEPMVVWLIFVSHWPIDRWSLAASWLRLIRGRNLGAAIESKDPTEISFAALVYAVVDNAMHLIAMWAIVRFVLIPLSAGG